jgi:hypothetical protein
MNRNKYSRCAQESKFYQVEIVDFDNETHFFEVEAQNEQEADSKASRIFGGDIYMMNIYES